LFRCAVVWLSFEPAAKVKLEDRAHAARHHPRLHEFLAIEKISRPVNPTV
jgi:hypothetical protein